MGTTRRAMQLRYGRRRRAVDRVASVALLLMTVLVSVAGCGGGSPQEQPSTAAQAPVNITVGAVPIVDVAPLYLGVEKGFFAHEHLNVTIKLAQGGAVIIPALVAGDYQFGFTNTVSLILGVANGLPLRVVSAGEQDGSNPKNDTWAILVKSGSPIAQCKDLEGKTIAINTLKNIGEVTVKASCDKPGVDVTKFKLVEMNFPDQLPALLKGQIDAMWTTEPFATQAKQGGASVFSYNVVEVEPHLAFGVYFTSASYRSQNGGIVQRFTAAMNNALDYATAHPADARAAVGTYTTVAAPILQQMVLPSWSHTLDTASIDRMAGRMVKYGLIGAAPNMKPVYPS